MEGGVGTRPQGVRILRSIGYGEKSFGHHRAPTSPQSTQTTSFRTYPAPVEVFWGSGGWVNYFATTFLPPATTLQLLVNYLKFAQLPKICVFMKNRKRLSFPMIPVFYGMSRNVLCAHMCGKTSQFDPQRAQTLSFEVVIALSRAGAF